MNRFARIVLTFLCFELGVLLLILPWSGLWERNFFLQRYPELLPLLLNPFLRGAISGLGLLDVGIAAGMLRRSTPKAVA